MTKVVVFEGVVVGEERKNGDEEVLNNAEVDHLRVVVALEDEGGEEGIRLARSDP